jgi:phage shock protein A
MSIFQRIFKVAQSGAHSVIDQIEDPIQLTEQGIRDLKKDLQAAMESLAQVKATAIRLRKDGEDQMKRAADYERKAMLVLQKMQEGQLDAAQAEGLATEALQQKEESSRRGATLAADYEQQKKMADQLQGKIDQLKHTVRTYENELVTLKARARTASSMRKINEQMVKLDSSGTVAMLERMKNKVMEEETLAEAYGEMGGMEPDLDKQLDKALAAPPSGAPTDALVDLKKRMGLLPSS